MKRIGSEEKRLLLEYLQSEPQFNVYMIGDLEKYGTNSKCVEFFRNDEDKLRVVLMRFYESFVIYSYDNSYSIDDVRKTISEYGFESDLSCVTGKASTIKKLSENRIEQIRTTNILMMDIDSFRAYKSLWKVETLEERVCGELLKLYLSVPEMSEKYNNDSEETKRDIRGFLESGTAYVIRSEGEVVASISATAVSESSAMLVNVCTSLAFRNQGMCRAILNRIGNALLTKSRKLYIYYENKSAGEIYRSVGFYDAGEYARIGVKRLLK